MNCDAAIERALDQVSKIFRTGLKPDHYTYHYLTPGESKWWTAEPGTQVTARARRMRYVIHLAAKEVGIANLAKGIYNAKSSTVVAFLTVIVRREVLQQASRANRRNAIDNRRSRHRKTETIEEEIARKTPKAPPIAPLAAHLGRIHPHLTPAQLIDLARFALDVG